MVISLNNLPTVVKDRTGTIAFMAVSMLGSSPSTHRLIHDCESIFWLCTLDLLSRVGVGDIKDYLANIANPGRGILFVGSVKTFVILNLSMFKGKTEWLKTLVSLDKPKDSSLFFCLTALMREFVTNNYI